MDKKYETSNEYRERMIQAFQNAKCDELIALVALPTEKEFEHLEWLLKNEWNKNKEENNNGFRKESC